jgi:CBS domain-containing protein
MQLVSYLDARDCCVEHRILTKQQVYKDLVERVSRHNSLPQCGLELYEMLLKRDEEAPTAYSTGIAIPHVRMEDFQDTIVAMAFLQNPIEMEGISVSWVVLIITNKTSSKLYLNMVAALLKLSKDTQAMQTLFTANDGHAVFQHLKKMGVEIKKDICISDIMIKDPISILPDATLHELNNAMNTQHIAGLPVVDSDGKYIGEVNILDVLKVGIPEYLMMLDNVNFLMSYEPLENLFDREHIVKVGDIMSEDDKVLHPEASVIEAVFEMIGSRKRYMSVVKDGKLVGLVTAMDILRKIVTA